MRVAFDDVRGGYAERAIDIIVEIGEAVFFFQLIEREKDLLCAADAKGRDDELAFFLAAGMIDPFEEHTRRRLDRIVEAVAIGGFDQDIIGLGEYLGGPEDDIFISAHVAAEAEMGLFALFDDLEMDGGAADDMPCICPEDLHILVDGVPGIVFHADEVIHAAFGVFFGI